MKEIKKKIKIYLLCFIIFPFIDNKSYSYDKKYLKATDLIKSSDSALKLISINKDLKSFNNYLKNSKAIIIFPEIYEGGLFFGAKGGTGILLIKRNKKWVGPFFYSIGGLSFGLQLGIKSGKAVMTIMSSRGLESILKEKVKIGVDIDGAIISEGVGFSANSTVRLADIYTFSDNSGLFLGGSIDGAYLQSRNDLNFALYKKKLIPDEIMEFDILHKSSKEINSTLDKILK